MFAWLRSWLAKSPPPEYAVDGLGLLKFERQLWHGAFDHDGQELLVSCGGDRARPAEHDLERLRCVWAARRRYFERAQAYLEMNEADAELPLAGCAPFGIAIERWGDADCTIELLAPDDETVWRVAFRGESPVRHSFDH